MGTIQTTSPVLLCPAGGQRYPAAFPIEIERSFRAGTVNVMSLQGALARIGEIQGLLAAPSPPTPAQAHAVTSPASTIAAQAAASAQPSAAATSFADTMASVRASDANTPASKIIQMARQELAAGVAEQPPGSNESSRIAEYRTAVAGNYGPGPWCAYFTSFLTKNAGVPIGPDGSGFASVDAAAAWAQQNGRWSQQPRPGDLVVWDEHIGVVTEVLADGRLKTIEGNSSNKVSELTRSRSGVLGFIRTS